MKILIVDDEIHQREILRLMAGIYYPGIRVYEATNSSEGFALAGKETFDLIIMDYMLPGGNGMVALDDWKTNLPDCPPIIMISCAMTETLRRKLIALKASSAHDKLKFMKDDLMRDAIEEAIGQ